MQGEMEIFFEENGLSMLLISKEKNRGCKQRKFDKTKFGKSANKSV